MRIRAVLILALAAPLALTSCASRQDSGTLLGAVAGGVIGNQFGGGSGRVLATAAGAVAGGMIGNSIGRDLDELDRRRAMEAEYQALEYGESGSYREWRGERSGRRGRIQVEKPFKQGPRHCRRYAHTIYIDGRPEVARGTACRGENGRWQTVS
jgi:surface antigen